MSRVPAAVSLLGIGWYFAVSIVGGIAGGLLLDGWLGTKPLFTLVGLGAGLLLAFWGGFKLLMRVMANRYQQKGTGENQG